VETSGIIAVVAADKVRAVVEIALTVVPLGIAFATLVVTTCPTEIRAFEAESVTVVDPLLVAPEVACDVPVFRLLR
jgi:hypothetical protein